MDDYKKLIPNKYFNLNYSLIPDNNIQKVVGTYKTIDFTDEYTYEDDTLHDRYYLKKKDGAIVGGSLPLIPGDSLNNLYTDEYYEIVDYTTDGKPYPLETRHERIQAQYSITVEDDMPIKFYAEDGAIYTHNVQGQTHTRSGVNLTGWESLWLAGISKADNQIWGFTSLNMGGGGTYETTNIDSLEIDDMVVDSYWDGNKISSNNKFRLVVWFNVSIIDNYHECQSAISGSTGFVRVKDLTGFKCTIKYYTATASKEIEFEVHSPSTEYPYYNDYPLRIDGNEFTNGNTVVNSEGSNIPWHLWISDQLLHNYQDGKLFINTKLKASFLRDNNLDINSEVLIKDIDNQYISKEVIEDEETKEHYIVFSIKNIEYVYSGSEFIANVVLLETGEVSPDLSFSVYSYIVIDTSAYAMSIETKDSPMIIGEHIDGVINPDTLQVENVKGYIPFAITGNALFDSVDLVDIAFMMAMGAANIMFAIAFIDTVAVEFDPAFGFDMEGNISKREIVPVRFRSAISFTGFVDMYSYTKVDTGFDIHDGFYINNPEALSIDCTSAQFDESNGFYVSNPEVICVSQIDTNISFESVFDIQGSITKDTVIDTNISTSLFDFKANRLTKIDKIVGTNNKATSFLSSIGYSGFATMNKIGERPIDNTYFFNWDISEFLDTPIEMDSENHIDGFFEIYLT